MKLLSFLTIQRLLVLAALIYLTFFVSAEGNAADSGYSEAMEYFVQRRRVSQVQEPQNPGVYQDYMSARQEEAAPVVAGSGKRSKFFISLGFENGREPFEDTRVLELGMAVSESKWIQSNLSLEWRSIFGESGDAVAFMYSVQPSSVLFFLGPEIGFGAGRSWVVGDGEGFTSLKVGLNVSNPWTKKYLVAFSVYYRRDQGIRDSFHDDRFGALLRFGF